MIANLILQYNVISSMLLPFNSPVVVAPTKETQHPWIRGIGCGTASAVMGFADGDLFRRASVAKGNPEV